MRVDILNRLEHHLKEFGFDPKAKDAAHVFRFVGTTNTKRVGDTERNGKTVRAFAVGNSTPYSITSLTNQMQKNVAEKPKPKTKTKPAKVKAIEEHKKHRLYARADRIIADLFKLTDVREVLADTCRELLCYLVRNFYHHKHRIVFQHGSDEERARLFSESEALAIELNNRFKEPLPLEEVVKWTKTEKKIYPYKNETIVKQLELTAEEQAQMSELISDAKVIRSRKTINESNRRMKKGAKNRQLLYSRIEKCIKENPTWTNVQISEVVKCDKKTVSGVRKSLK
jgi:hypothetical protein